MSANTARSWSAEGAVKNFPPVPSAMVWRALESTGTWTVWPALSTLALAVPKAMVDTGTLAALAAAMASASLRPVVLFPSDRSTMLAAGVLGVCAVAPLAPVVVGVVMADGRALRAVKMASPRAVPGLVARRPRAVSTAWWSVLGATRTSGVASALTMPTENVAGSPSMNDRAAAWAAAS